MADDESKLRNADQGNKKTRNEEWSAFASFRYRGALAVNINSLKATERILRNLVAGEGESGESTREAVVVLTRGGSPDQFDRVDPIEELRNSRSRPITAIILACGGPGGESTMRFDSCGEDRKYAFVFEAKSSSVDRLSATVALVEEELKNVRTWYALIRRCVDWLAALPRVFWLVVLLLWALGFGLYMVTSAYRAHQFAEWQQGARELLETLEAEPIPEDSDSSEKIETLRSLADARNPMLITVTTVVIAAAFWFLVGMFAPRCFGWLFPRVIFDIGEGRQRHHRTLQIQIVVLVTIVTSGFVIPLVRKWLFGV